jgi:hypothetical protein
MIDKYDTHAYWLRESIRAERVHRGHMLKRYFGRVWAVYRDAFRRLGQIFALTVPAQHRWLDPSTGVASAHGQKEASRSRRLQEAQPVAGRTQGRP